MRTSSDLKRTRGNLKKCTKCHLSREDEEFSRRGYGNRPAALRASCKVCEKARCREHRMRITAGRFGRCSRGGCKRVASSIGGMCYLHRQRLLKCGDPGEDEARLAPATFINSDGLKNCSKCGEFKPLEEFYKDRHIKSGLQGVCKRCDAVIYWIGRLLSSSKYGSKKRGHRPPEVTADDIKDMFVRQNGRCYYSGIQMVPSAAAKSPRQPSLERLDSNIGYTKANTVLVCLMVQYGKNAATVQEFMSVIDEIRKSKPRKQPPTVESLPLFKDLE